MTSETPTVHVFYDYVCPYAYIGKKRADRLEQEFDVRFVWLPWEIHPEAVPEGEPFEGRVSGWVKRLADELDLDMKAPSSTVNSNLALRGAEYAKDRGEETFRKYNDLAFEAVWGRGENLGDEAVLERVVTDAGMDWDAFREGVRHHAYQYRLDEVDRAATRVGIARVPTFVFGDQRIVGNDPFEDSLKRPLAAFLERWKALGEDGSSTLEEDFSLEDFE